MPLSARSRKRLPQVSGKRVGGQWHSTITHYLGDLCEWRGEHHYSLSFTH